MLSTFQLVYQNKIISPVLTTTREYGNWFEDTFDKYTAQLELYLKSKKQGGESVLEWHPGTKIGHWFDTSNVSSGNLQSWFILKDSPAMDKIVKLNMAEQRDAIPISVNDEKGRRMLRVYTAEQIQLYIRSTLDKTFSISQHLGTPKQIKVNSLDKIIMPEVKIQKKRLF